MGEIARWLSQNRQLELSLRFESLAFFGGHISPQMQRLVLTDHVRCAAIRIARLAFFFFFSFVPRGIVEWLARVDSGRWTLAIGDWRFCPSKDPGIWNHHLETAFSRFQALLGQAVDMVQSLWCWQVETPPSSAPASPASNQKSPGYRCKCWLLGSTIGDKTITYLTLWPGFQPQTPSPYGQTHWATPLREADFESILAGFDQHWSKTVDSDQKLPEIGPKLTLMRGLVGGVSRVGRGALWLGSKITKQTYSRRSI